MKIIKIAAMLLFFSATSQGQNVGISATGATPNASAGLDIDFNNRGLLIPRMTTIQRNAIPSPAQSLLIFNTTTNCFEWRDNLGNAWVSMSCGCQIPGAFSATAATNLATTSFDANWTASSGATAYYLDVNTDSAFTGAWILQNVNVGNVITYGVTGLTCATNYYYRVRADNSCGTSANSNTVTVTTSACSTCGTPFTDARDGKSYNTVLIGTQCWMAENLNYGTYVPVLGTQNSGEKFCQNLSGVNDATCPMGGLYDWANLMQGSASCNGTGAPPNDICVTPVQGLCPAGWHIPSHYEWTTLEKNVGSNPGAFPYDITTTGWLGTDEGGNMKVVPICGSLPCWNTPNTGATNSSGFSALPGGLSSSGTFNNVGWYSSWWSVTENGTSAWCRNLGENTAQTARYTLVKTSGRSVRCVKD